MKKFLLLAALTMTSFAGIQAMSHREMKEKVAQYQETIITAFNGLKESSEKSTTLSHTEDDLRFDISKCLFDIRCKQNPNSFNHDNRLDQSMDIIFNESIFDSLVNALIGSITGSKTVNITLIDTSKK